MRRRRKRADPTRFYGLLDLDEKLIPYVRQGRGTFVELGAFDGLDQSNTAWLEANRGWRGILIEPVPESYERCLRNRPLATVVNCACVSGSYRAARVEVLYSGLMSIVRGARSNEDADNAWVSLGEELQHLTRYTCSVPARTLTSVLDGNGLRYVDLLSLDVEGYEFKVLEGFDLDRFRPHHILVEESGREAVDEYLTARGYLRIAEIGRGEKTVDVLYERSPDSPPWIERLRRSLLRRRFFVRTFVARCSRAVQRGAAA